MPIPKRHEVRSMSGGEGPSPRGALASSRERSVTTVEALAESAKNALERVCSGAGIDPPSRYYSPSFVDHVNDLELRGLAGAERSVALYRTLLSEMSITVEEQVVDGDRVTSRFVVQGTSGGRRVRFNGITISRFEDGLIVEDWSVTDTLGMLKQLGLVRSLWLGARSFRALVDLSRALEPGLGPGARPRA